jgi:DNA polymerase-3 subunit gamma/tau
MLTTEAFNALLKTLEEPPEHTLFVFATTESHKVPATILSRCQRFDFRLIPLADIIKHLQWIAEKEQVSVTEEAMTLIARRAAGCLRDAQSMLDQLIAFGAPDGEKELDTAMVEQLLGVVHEEVYLKTGVALLTGNLSDALGELRALLNRGYDLGEITRGFIAYLGSIILTKFETEGITGGKTSQISRRLSEELKDVSPDDILRASDILTTTEREMNRSTQPELLLELAFVKIARMGKTVEIDRIMTRLEELASGAGGPPGPLESAPAEPQADLFNAPEQEPQPGQSDAPETGPVDGQPRDSQRRTAAEEPDQTVPQPDSGTAAESKPDSSSGLDIEAIRGRWHDFIDKVNHRRGSVGACLEVAELISFNDGVLLLGFAPENHFHRERVQELTVRQMIEKAAADFFGLPLKIECTTTEAVQKNDEPTSKSEKSGQTTDFEREPIINKSIDLLDLERLPGG